MSEESKKVQEVEFTLNSVAIVADTFVPDMDEELEISEEV